MSKKSILNKIAELFTAEQTQDVTLEFVDVKTQDNRILRVSDLALDGTIEEILEDGSVVVLENGDYTLEDGTVVSVLDGKIAEIAKQEEEAQDVEEDLEDVSTEELEAVYADVPLEDDTMIQVEVQEVDAPLAIGDKVWKDGVVATEGSFKLKDGRVLLLDSEGKIAEIKDAEAADTADMEVELSSEEQDILDVVSNLKALIDEVKSLRSDFDSIRKENEELKGNVEKFSKAPSANSSLNFDFKVTEEKPKSHIHSKLGL
jgi:prefoldin subunit 5